VLTGIAFVLATVAAARVAVNLVALVMATSVQHADPGERERLEREYVPLATKVTWLASILVGTSVVAKHFGKDVSAILAALGVGSLAIGLAAQQTLGNMIAGFTLLADRPFRVGDRIRLASGESGQVIDIGVRSTRIRLGDGNLLIVPNAELANSRVVNFATAGTVHGEVRVLVAHDSDVERACRALEELAASEPRAQRAAARVAALGAAGIELGLGFDARWPDEAAAVEDALRRRVVPQLRAAGVGLAAPPRAP
jgi:small-conductance mechanosensitive channel